MNARTAAAVAVAVLVTAGIGQGCTQPAIEKDRRQTFEQGDEGWIPFGADARVEIVRDRAMAKSGEAALALRYTFNPGQYGSAVLPLEAGELSGLRRLEFWIKTDHATPVIVVLSEKQPGGYYSSWFWCAKDQWVHVSLTPQDFVLNQGPSDPPDPDGRLDLDEVRGIGISDLGQAYQTLGTDPNYPLFVDKVTGPRTILLDDFEWLAQSAESPAGPWTDKVIGHPERGLVTWIALGGTDLSIAEQPGSPGQVGFSARYEQTFGRYVAISHSLLDHDLHDVQRLRVSIASQNDANLMVYLEEKKAGAPLGPRYSHPLTVPGGNKPATVELVLSEFQPDTTGLADQDGKLDADQLKSISIVDITAASSRPSRSNVLWISPIAAR